MNLQHKAADEMAEFAVTHRAELDRLSRQRPTPEQAQRTALAVAHMRAQDRRFTGEPLTGFGDLR